MKEALEGLPGVAAVEMDLERDLFRVQAAADRPTEEEMIKAIKDRGFEATVVLSEDRKSSVPENTDGDKAPSPMPQLVQKALDQAGKEGKLLLVDFYAEWCAPCKRMIDETYKDARVIAELERFIFLKVNTDVHPDISKHFKVSGIPDARFLAPDGTELGRMLGFKSADETIQLLREAR
ncbi:MAG: thioredoxin domain-containing protein [Planctomycetota bacterium]|nr:thioredoxin domain-containing protein [Planctomycetota bacterium]